MDSFIFNWINENLGSAVPLILIFAFAEACIGIGLFISGIFLVGISTLMLDQQAASISLISLLAFIGALAGDQFGFYVGRWIGPLFYDIRFVKNREDSFNKATIAIKKYGSFAVFIGRFIPAIRSLIPAMLGISGFNRIAFLFLDVLACSLWSLALAAIVLGIGNIF
ncbi:MAG: VTT domain-containing protein [Gammaproteobacteria bacterium]|nr:VTT domain-containing protein [Gammaproteobacteria bacterium]